MNFVIIGIPFLATSFKIYITMIIKGEREFALKYISHALYLKRPPKEKNFQAWNNREAGVNYMQNPSIEITHLL